MTTAIRALLTAQRGSMIAALEGFGFEVNLPDPSVHRLSTRELASDCQALFNILQGVAGDTAGRFRVDETLDGMLAHPNLK